MIVVDASVAVQWFVPGQETDQAVALLRSDQKLLAPASIRIEVAATFIRLLRLNHIDGSNAQLLLDKWRQCLKRQAVGLEETLHHLEAAEGLSMALSHPLQDCLYLAMAKRLQIPLVTADKGFFATATAAGHEVTLLAEQ